ncbi:hypothetical protein BUALT_BualtUnG0060800 [Buddleja alternifolia]|uniref:F-box domain-containing protein n=1 Tax=Buddleja alternifolia TaxID=168488 RepID=A0AAV6W6E4_9LAMI|nr:hypothetical protein BUALT_BualtUnG0060800 [Buddleja alternifolia]
MSDIPSELFHHILCRVPVESLLLWWGVCKSWRRIIDDPAFIKSHINHQSSSTILGQLLVRNEMGGRLSCLSLDSINFVHHRQHQKIEVLWNPLTHEYYDLPERDADLHLDGWGLGYDILRDDFKIVRINRMFLNRELVLKTLIYSLKLNSWKWSKDYPAESFMRSDRGLYLNGALYWLSKSFVIALDLSTEDYSQLPFPSLSTEQWVDRRVNLDVLGGFLVQSCNYYRYCGIERVDGWEMKDDGGKISWTKLFSFEVSKDDFFGCEVKKLRPITYSKSNRHVLLQRDHEFFWLNTDDNCVKKLRIHGLRGSLCGSFSCQLWQGSLFRLGDIVGAKRIERVKKRRAKKRLKLDVTIAEVGNWPLSGYSSYSSEGEDEDEDEDY